MRSGIKGLLDVDEMTARGGADLRARSRVLQQGRADHGDARVPQAVTR
ncbi:MAG: hypothetical protein R3D52_15305 [Xanthobacteraceae bacterium]